MSRFPSIPTPCPHCGAVTIVDAGKFINTAYRRYRHCKLCGCKFTTTQRPGETGETIGLILVEGSAPQPIPPAAEQAEMPEPEPGTSWRDLSQMRRAMFVSAFLDVEAFGRIDPETLALAEQVREKKQERGRIAA